MGVVLSTIKTVASRRGGLSTILDFGRQIIG